jgi:alkylation response protein AidB-like acyl-CoA dehydrogenase
MDFQPSERAQSYAKRVRAFIDERIAPVESQHWKEIGEARHGGDWTQWKIPTRVEALKAQAKAEGLWNLFLPDAKLAPGLSVLEYAFSAR